MQLTDLIPERSTIIVGLSGGPDSIYLLDHLSSLLKAGKINAIIAAHLDHEWRADSSNDALFCKDLAQKYGVLFVNKKLSELNQSFTGSKEEIGRKARRYFFEQLLSAYNADFIALGHHAQDQQETFFIRLIRGASLPGLTGMRIKSGRYIRPLLNHSKAEIVQYLDAHKIPYLLDPSNESPEFLRNRIRNTVLPALRSVDPRFDMHLLQTMKRLEQTEEYLQAHTRELFDTLSSIKNSQRTIDLNKLLSLPLVMQHRLLMLWLTAEKVPFVATESFLNEIIRFLQMPESKTHTIHKEWAIKKQKRSASIIKQSSK